MLKCRCLEQMFDKIFEKHRKKIKQKNKGKQTIKTIQKWITEVNKMNHELVMLRGALRMKQSAKEFNKTITKSG